MKIHFSKISLRRLWATFSSIILGSVCAFDVYAESARPSAASEAPAVTFMPKEKEKQAKIRSPHKHRRPRLPSIRLMSQGALKAVEALKMPPLDPKSVWDKKVLDRNPELKSVLLKFVGGRYAASIKNVQLKGKTPEELHLTLTKAGFNVQEAPLSPPRKRRKFAENDNKVELLKPKKMPGLQRIYRHEDGGMVRLKHLPYNPGMRPQAHGSKAVLIDPKGSVAWENEAFKVTDSGVPIPKAPDEKYGLLMEAPNSEGADENRGWVDLIMEEAHPDLKIVEQEESVQKAA